MARILLTGVSTLDIINTVDNYPPEDSEVRAIEQATRTGGNACNSAKVLQQLDIHTSLLANYADDVSASYILNDLKQQNIDVSHCPVEKNSTTPTSYITINRQNGSRTIVHYRNLQELSASDFTRLNLNVFDWLHFEARNCDQLEKMLQHASLLNSKISIEVEKPRKNINAIFKYANVLLISRPYAESQNFSSAEHCLKDLSSKFPDKIITCSWGSDGAWAYTGEKIIYQPAFPVEHPIETLGAGDTFNAGFIAAQMKQHNVTESLAFACELASNKCQQTNLTQLLIPNLN